MSRTQKSILTVSLILNVLLIGLYVGHTLHCLLLPNDSRQAVAQLLAQIPEARRPLIEDNLHTIWHEIELSHKQMNEEKKVALKLLQAEPFNEQLYRAQIQKLNETHNAMKNHMTDSLIALAKQLNSQERSILAQITFYPPPDLPPTPLAKDR